MDDEDDDYASVQAGTAPKAGSMDNVLLQSMGESGRGPRNAVAEAVASPLRVQLSITVLDSPPPNRPAARDVQL
jgi:hypothetical protein